MNNLALREVEMEIVPMIDGKAVTTSLTIAQGVEQPQKAVIHLIRKHLA